MVSFIHVLSFQKQNPVPTYLPTYINSQHLSLSFYFFLSYLLLHKKASLEKLVVACSKFSPRNTTFLFGHRYLIYLVLLPLLFYDLRDSNQSSKDCVYICNDHFAAVMIHGEIQLAEMKACIGTRSQLLCEPNKDC